MDNLTEYIIPIGLLLLYFFASSGKKKKPDQKPLDRTPPRRESSAPKSRKPSPPPLQNAVPGSTLAVEKLDIEVESDLSDQIVSQEMQKYVKNDLNTLSAPVKKQSRARALFVRRLGSNQKGALREAILIKEILTRPFE